MLKHQRFVWVLSGIILSLLIASCNMPAGGYSSSKINGVEKVYRYDGGGEKVLVYEIDAAHKLTVYDQNDRRAQQMLARQQMAEQVTQTNAERIELIKHAPKRKPSDPIFVYLNLVELDNTMAQAEKPKGAIFEQIKKEFENDPIIRLVSKNKMKQGKTTGAINAMKGSSSDKAPGADVEISIRCFSKEVYGKNSKGKPASAPGVAFEAVVICNYIPADYKASESGHILKNVEVTRKLVDQIKNIIKNKIGPTIPANRSL